jgi:hypothetical protein
VTVAPASLAGPAAVAIAIAAVAVAAPVRAEDTPGSAAASGPPAPPPPASGFSLKLALGGDYRTLYGVPIYGGDARLSLGTRFGAWAVYGLAGLTLGPTQYGLGTTVIELGGSVERRFDPVALGASLRTSYLRVNRVTASGAFDSLGVGISPFISVDVISSEGHTLFVGGSASLDEYLVGSTSALPGATLFIGYREE